MFCFCLESLQPKTFVMPLFYFIFNVVVTIARLKQRHRNKKRFKIISTHFLLFPLFSRQQCKVTDLKLSHLPEQAIVAALTIIFIYSTQHKGTFLLLIPIGTAIATFIPKKLERYRCISSKCPHSNDRLSVFSILFIFSSQLSLKLHINYLNDIFRNPLTNTFSHCNSLDD